MLLSFDSILGIPTIETGGINTKNENNRNNSMGMNMGIPAILLLAVIIILFVLLFANLGKNATTSSVSDTTSSNSSNILTILLGGVVLVVILLNGFQYFFNINLTARLNNLFTDTPSMDLTVEQPVSQEIAPVPEIEIKKQVFHIPGNNYTYDNADALCKAYGARLATYSEVEDSYKNGAEWCSYGWSDRQLALFPTQKDTWNYLQTVEGHENDCGRAGINGGYIANENVKFGANCYGYKPKITDTELDMMQTAPLYPRTLKDVEEEKRVDYWRRKIPEILVSPFNKNVWSLL
jgi:hypothetical protein